MSGEIVTFGRIIDGIDVLRKIESYGSITGEASSKITVTLTGQVPPQPHNAHPEADK